MRIVYACSLRFPGRDAAETVWRAIAEWVERWYARNAPDVTLGAGWSDGTAGQLTPVRDHSLEAETLRLEGALRAVNFAHR